MNLAAPRRGAGPALGLALVLLAALSSGVRAEGAGPNDEKEARRLFQEAELSFNVGKFAEALTAYQAAYEAKPLPGFLFNVAQCYRNMGDYDRARFFFRRYLTLDPRTPNRRRVEALIEEMTRKLDEKPAEATPVDAGEPKAPAPVVAAPPPPPAPVETQPSQPILVAAAPPPARPLWKRWWFWTAAGAVVAGGVVAFVLTRPETRAPGTLPPIDGR